MTYAPEEIVEDSEKLEKKSEQLRKEFEIFLEEVAKKFDQLENNISRKTKIVVK